jgi:hypothetical protein
MDKMRLHLAEKRDKITRSLNLHKGLLSALWRLPAEVLSEIFVHCLPQTEYLEISLNSAPVLLTRICRRWREIAVGTSSLWCRLIVDCGRDWQQAASCYDLWLKRSRGRPVALKLEGIEDDATVATKLRSLLQPYRNQISSLLISHDIKAPERLLQNLPALQQLTMFASIRTSHYQPAVAECISQLSFTVRSLRLIWGYVSDFQHLCSFNPVWTNLTNVEIGVSNAHTFIYLLQLCVNLSSITIGIPCRDWSEDVVLVALEPFTHTQLRSWSISGSVWATPNSLPDLFNSLSLPNLRVLDACDVDMLWWPHEEFKTFLARSNCSLERLLVPGRVMIGEQKAEYITLIPSLEVVVDTRVPRGYLR